VFYCRRLSSYALDTIQKQYRGTLSIPWCQWDQVTRLHDALGPLSPEAGAGAHDPKLAACIHMEEKIDHMLRSLHGQMVHSPASGNGRLGGAVLHISPGEVVFAQSPAVPVHVGEILEGSLGVMADPSFQLRLLARIVRIDPPEPDDPQQDGVQHSRVVCHAIPLEPFVESTPVMSDGMSVSSEAAAEQAAAEQAAAAAREAANRRRAFRLTDPSMPLSWRLISEEEHRHAWEYFKANDLTIPPLARCTVHEASNAKCKAYLDSIVLSGNQGRRALLWLFHQCNAWQNRSNFAEEDQFAADIIDALTRIALRIAPEPRILSNPVVMRAFVAIQTHWQEMDRQKHKLLARTNFQDVLDQQKELVVSGLYDEIVEAIDAMGDMAPGLVVEIQQLVALVQQLLVTPRDPLSKVDAIDSPWISQSVNLSSTGVAFHSFLGNRLQKGDLLELYLGLSVDGIFFKRHVCHGRITMVSAPNSHGRYRIAAHYTLANDEFEDVLNAHMVRKQREFSLQQRRDELAAARVAPRGMDSNP
jgi:hypothetical protein